MPDAESPQYGAYGQAGQGKAAELKEQREEQRAAQSLTPASVLAEFRAMKQDSAAIKKRLDAIESKWKTLRGAGDVTVHDGVISFNGRAGGGIFRGIVFPDGVAQYADVNGALRELVTT